MLVKKIKLRFATQKKQAKNVFRVADEAQFLDLTLP
jgi:hypothetical protein